jgi:transcriptional regulator with XRE-family HTH domain
MKLGDVLKKERNKKPLTVTATANRLGVTEDEYRDIEAGGSPAEEWGPLLAEIAIQLETPTSRLLAESGRAADARPGQAGVLIRGHRERREKTAEQMAEALGIPLERYETIEAGTSPLETYGPLLLAFAEAIEQPVFNLFYPCGLPFRELDDYP